MNLLEVKNITTTFTTRAGKVNAIEDVSFSLKKGESLALIGESGCGKTTTALSISRLLPPEGKVTAGEIWLNGRNILKMNDIKFRRVRWNEIAYVFQGSMNAFNPVLKLSKQISEVIMLHKGVDEQTALKKVKDLFEMVEINSKRIHQYPHEFSGGMKQRAMIAMALACDPQLLIGDEPTTALDVMVQAQILDLLNRLRKELQMSVILITHDLSLIGDYCDRGAVMYGGKIVEIGKSREILQNYSHVYTEKLIGTYPQLGGKREMVSSIKGDVIDLRNLPKGCRFQERCDLVTDRCRTELPELKAVRDDHFVACHERGGVLVDSY